MPKLRFSFGGPACCSSLPISLAILSVIGDNMFLLIGIIACDQSHCRFGGAKIDRLVRDVGFDINEISRFTDNRILQLLAVTRIHPTFEQVNSRFIPLVKVRLSRAARGMIIKFMEMFFAPAVTS